MTDLSEKQKVVPPRDAATLILMDFSTKLPKILMGRRHSSHSFMPNKFVFPGGRVDASDRKMNIASPLDQMVEDRLAMKARHMSSMKARAIALAAIRETFEETGIMLGETGMGAPPKVVGTPWETYSAHEIWPSLDQLHFIARAITPKKHHKRFDTRFFLADSANIAHSETGKVGPDSELTEIVWVTLTEAKKLDLPSITSMIIDEITLRLEQGMKHYLPVPYFHEFRGRYVREEL